MKKHGLAPWRLTLEVAERAYAESPQQLMQAVAAFRAAGFCVVMDDFGGGDASLSMLKHLPVDRLKLDVGFLQHDEREARARVIFEGIASTAKRLGMGIVVQGVETAAQRDYLASIGCEKMQGYVYARPMPADEFRQILRRDGVERM